LQFSPVLIESVCLRRLLAHVRAAAGPEPGLTSVAIARIAMPPARGLVVIARFLFAVIRLVGVTRLGIRPVLEGGVGAGFVRTSDPLRSGVL
jgi:hypothetical protein